MRYWSAELSTNALFIGQECGEVSTLVRRLGAAAGSFEALSGQTGVPLRSILYYANGEREPSVFVLVKLCKPFGSLAFVGKNNEKI